MRYWAYNILFFDTFTTIFDVFNWVCLFSMIFWTQKLILVRLPTSLTYFVAKMSIYENIQNIWFVGLALQHISFEFRKLTWYKNNSWKIEISIFCKIFKKKWKIHDYDTTSLSHIIMNFRAIWVLVPSKFQVFSKVFEFLKFYKILSFLVKIWSYGQKRIFLWSW